MKWRVFVIGKPSLRYAREGVEEYLRRFPLQQAVEVIHLKASTPEQEAGHFLEKSEGTHRIALDERGKVFTTLELSREVSKLSSRGVGRASLLIGGASGHEKSLLKRVDAVWSLSPLTLQHELALVVLLEQLYRVYALSSGHPYHREG